jgi:hypothetical protein
MPDLITQAEFARRMGVNRKEVTKWKQQGRLVWKGGKIDLEATKKVLADTADPARVPQKVTKGRGVSFTDARTQKEIGRSILIGLEVKEKKGELVNAQAVLSELIKSNIAVKNRIRSIPSFIHLDISQIYGVTDVKKQREVSGLISKYLDEALKELSEWKPTKS